MADGAENRIPNVLSIAGVDPSGGAGLLADIKAMSACGTYACGVVTALTAQNTKGVDGIFDVTPDFVREQLETLFADVRIDAVKIGMLSNAGVVAAVAESLERHRPGFVVLDPVMVAKSMDRLLAPAAVEALKTRLLPLANLITPNVPECADLLGISEGEVLADLEGSARALWRLMGRRDGWVLLKGGHVPGKDATDLLLSGNVVVQFPAERIDTKNTHGTGCTLSAAIAARYAVRGDMLAAVKEAKDYITGAIRHSGELSVGHGCGPTHHFWSAWQNVK